MKTVYFLFVFVFWLGFAFNDNAKAQDVDCPEGGTLYEAYFIGNCFSVPGCRFRVLYCCYFDEINLRLELRIKRIDFLGNEEPYSQWVCYYVCYYYTPQLFWSAIFNAVREDAIERCLSWIPNCDEGIYIGVKEYRSQCWYYENFWFTKYEHQWLLVMRPCGALSCIHEYKICKRGTEIVVLDEKWTVTAPPDCSTEEPTELPPLGKTWEEYWRTDCFAKPCSPQ